MSFLEKFNVQRLNTSGNVVKPVKFKNRFLIVNPLLPYNFPPSMSADDPSQPVSVDLGFSKNISERRTVGGYTFTHWGEAPSDLTAKGTILLQPGKEQIGFATLAILKQLYRLDKTRLNSITALLMKSMTMINGGGFGAAPEMNATSFLTSLIPFGVTVLGKLDPNVLSYSYIFYDYIIYGGHFTKFHYTRDATRPRMVDYDFAFRVTWSSDNYLVDKVLNLTNKLSSSIVKGISPVSIM